MSEFVGCLLIPQFPLACELAQRPQLWSAPVVVARSAPPLIWAVSPPAQRYGVRVEQSLREAISRCPSLEVIAGRPPYYRHQSDALLTALELVVPGVEPREDGVIYLDLRGLTRCYPSSDAMHTTILRSAPPALRPRLGIATTPFAALLAAHAAQPHTTRVVTKHDTPSFLAQQSTAVLPVSEEIQRRLRFLGITKLRDIIKIRKSAFVAQFGKEGAHTWDLAKGNDPSRVTPRPWRDRIIEKLSCTQPLTTHQAFLTAIKVATSRAVRQRTFRTKATRQVTITAHTDRGAQWDRTITLKEASSQLPRIWEVIHSSLSDVRLPGPIVEIILELASLTPRQGRQVALPTLDGGRRIQLEDGLRKLRVRYGYCPVARIVEVEPWSRIPEHRLALSDFIA